MTHEQHQETVSSQQSIHFSLSEVEEEFGTRPFAVPSISYLRLLAGDVARSIDTGMRASHRHPVRIVLEPPQKDVEKLIASAIAGLDYNGNTLDEALPEFMHDCVYTVMAFGEAVYELVYHTDRKTGRVVRFNLRLIPPGSLERHRGSLAQHLPPAVARRIGVQERIELRPDSILAFLPPAPFRVELAAMRRRLSGTNALGEIASAIDRQLREGTPLPFNPAAHMRVEHLAVAQATRAVGWDVRHLIRKEVTEYYAVQRRLRFERFKCLLSDDIIATLNEGLERIGRRAEFSARIALSGMPTVMDLDEAEAQLARGDRTFEDVLRPFLLS